MSQHDMVLQNQSRTLFRQDVQNAVQALASLNNGTGDPDVMYPYEIKIDTSPLPGGNPIVYIRNAVNDDWVEWGYINKDTGRLWIKDVEGLSGLLADDQHVLYAEVVLAAKTVKLDDFTAPDDNTDLNASTTKHGLMPKLDNNLTHFLNGQGGWTVPSGSIISPVHTQTGEVAIGITLMPRDDSIPENTEGDEYMTLAKTPANANNILYIDVCIHLSTTSNNQWMMAALFQDSIVNALACGFEHCPGDSTVQIKFRHKMVAGTTSPITFKVRAGGSSAGTTTFNGLASGRLYGGVLASSITITEVVA